MYTTASKQDMEAKLLMKSGFYHLVRDPYIVVNTIVFIFLLAILSIIVNQLRNACHASLIRNYSGIRTKQCTSCHRNWIPGELTIRRTSKMSESELQAACESRGLRALSSVKDARRLVRPLRRALYFENISFRRPWTIFTACITIDRGLCRDFPCQWSAFLCILAIYISYQYWEFQNNFDVE